MRPHRGLHLDDSVNLRGREHKAGVEPRRHCRDRIRCEPQRRSSSRLSATRLSLRPISETSASFSYAPTTIRRWQRHCHDYSTPGSRRSSSEAPMSRPQGDACPRTPCLGTRRSHETSTRSPKYTTRPRVRRVAFFLPVWTIDASAVAPARLGGLPGGALARTVKEATCAQ